MTGRRAALIAAAEQQRGILARMGAVAEWDAARGAIPGSQWLLNTGSGGQHLRAKFGSVARAEVRNGALVLPGVVGNYAQVPASPVYVPDNLTVRARIAADSYGPAATYRAIAANGWDMAGQQSWFFGMNSAGRASFYMSANGTSIAGYEPPVDLTTVGAPGAELDLMVTRPKATGLVSIYARPSAGDLTSDDGWQLLGSSAPSVGTTPFATTQGLRIGGSFGGAMNPFAGLVRRLIVGSIGGSVALDTDFAGCADLASSFTANHGYGIKNGRLVGSGRVGPSGQGFGQYASTPNSAAVAVTGNIVITGKVVVPATLPGVMQCIASKRGASGSAYRLGFAAGRLNFVKWSGTVPYIADSTLDLPYAQGSTCHVRLTHTVATGVTIFETSPDGVAFSQLGGPVTIGAGLAIDTTLSPLIIGAGIDTNGDEPWTAAIHNVSINSFSVDFAGQPDDTQSFVCSTGQTITMTGFARPVVTITAANAVDTNDPLWCGWAGTNHVYLPGSMGNHMTVVPGGLGAITTDAEMAVRVALDTIGVNGPIAGWGSTYGSFDVTAGNQMALGYRRDDTGFVGQGFSSAIPGLAAGVPIWLQGRVTFATAGCDYWYSLDDTNDVDAVTWTKIGGTVIGNLAGSVPNLAQSGAILLGTNSSGVAGRGGKYYAMREIVDGVVRSKFRLDTVAGGGITSHPALVGPSVGIALAATGRKTVVVTRPVCLFGVDDFLEVADSDLLDFGAGQDFSVVSVWRMWGAGGGYMAYVSKTYPDTFTTSGYLQGRQAAGRGTWTQVYLNDTSPHFTGITAQPYTDGALSVIASRRAGDVLSTSLNAATPTSITGAGGSVANALPLRIGFNPTGSGMPIDGEFITAGVFRWALTDAEVANAVKQIGAAA